MSIIARFEKLTSYTLITQQHQVYGLIWKTHSWSCLSFFLQFSDMGIFWIALKERGEKRNKDRGELVRKVSALQYTNLITSHLQYSVCLEHCTHAKLWQHITVRIFFIWEALDVKIFNLHACKWFVNNPICKFHCHSMYVSTLPWCIHTFEVSLHAEVSTGLRSNYSLPT